MDFFDIHTHKKEQSSGVFQIENKYPTDADFSYPFSIGIHPWYINQQQIKQELEIVERKLQLPNCFAVGECGLDKLVEIPFELQLEVFKKQIQFSESYQKPLMIHCVKAFNEIIQLKKEIKPKQKWIIHGFEKNKTIAQSLVKNDMYLSFGAKIINNLSLQEVLVETPLSKLFLETDDSAIEIAKIYEKVAAIKMMTLTELQQQIKTNFTNIFLR